MNVRRIFPWVILIGILCKVQAEGERWSRQISNSEWIPLASSHSSQRSQNPASIAAAGGTATITDSNVQAAGQVPVLSLPPALQQQYQEQLLQLQKTQESIQRLLLLQQQLKTQQQLLQSQAYQPNGFTSAENDKQALHQSALVNLQTLPELAPEVLVPPVPSSEALPPVFRAQNFHPADSELQHDHRHRGQHTVASSPSSSEQDYRQIHDESISRQTSHPREDTEKDYRTRQKSRYESSQRHKDEPSHVNFVTPATSSAQESSDGEEEEVQLVYVPAETLAQRGQGKLHRSQLRKQQPNRHHQHHEEVSSSSSADDDAYAREILQQLQRQQDEQNKFLQLEREKEMARLQAEQKEMERQARLHAEVVKKEQELMRQRDLEKKRKDLERIEEAARQRELKKIQEAREKERQQKAKEEEERRREFERLADYEKEEKDLRRQKQYEQSKEHEIRTRPEVLHNQEFSEAYEIENPNAQSLIQDSQLHHQHLTEVTHKNIKDSRPRSKLRNKSHHYQQQRQQEFYEPAEVQTTTPSPNQPPLSVYMGNSLSDHRRVQLIDVLKTLKNAKTIAVLDSFGPDTPRVFVGPRNLDPPASYVKFDLPYLSAIENNRVERKVDKLPFFVAPLSFEPPPGYSKIPFPAPHIGSVVINSLENVETKPVEHQNLNPTPLIEPNAYIENNQPLPTYDSTPVSYSQESSSPRYEQPSSSPPSQLSNKWRYKEFYETKPTTEIPSAITAASYHEERTSTSKFERPSKNKNYYNPNEVPTTPNYYSPKTVTAFSFEQTVQHSTPAYSEESTRQHNVDSHLIDQNVGNHRQVINRYPDPEPEQQTNQRYPIDPTGHTVTNEYFTKQSPTYEEQTQYNLPAELPAISPQLPGLVNALVEKSEISSTVQAPTTTTTTTTTTTEAPTTYRSRTRHRGRVTATRATTTTLSPPVRSHTERSRRPIHRSRSKYTTTTEDYRDSSYDLTRKNSITTSRYEDRDSHVKRPIDHNYKSREEDTRESVHSQIVDSSTSNEQGQRGSSYENLPSIDSVSSSLSSDASLQSGGVSSADLNIPVYQHDDYSASTPAQIDNFSNRDSGGSDSILPLSGLEYVRKSTHTPNYHSSSTHEQTDERPTSGFNYRTQEDGSNSQTTRDFSYYRPGKTESVMFEPLPTTDLPNVQRSQLQNFSPVYHSVSAQGQYEKNETPRPVYRGPSDNREEEPPIFLPIPEDKQEDYGYQSPVTESLPEITTSTTTTTTTTTTETPVIIRQRVRGRLGGRTSHRPDSAIQTRPHGSQDEYVRFSAVNQDSTRSNSRQRTRPRSRAQPTQHQHSPIQTDGQEYVRIQTAPNQTRKPTTSATTPPTIRTTEEQVHANEEEYGFIRAPNFKPSLQSNFKPPQLTQSAEPIPETTPPSEPSPTQAQILKNRQKFYTAARRPASTRRTTTPRSDESSYTLRPRARPSQSEDSRPAKSRSRLRRPGARRRTTTTTTESTIDANNELPLDENYPRVLPQAIQESGENVQSDLYIEKSPIMYDQTPTRTISNRAQELADENYPQEFLLNFGASQGFHRDDYDQAQLASDSSRRQHSYLNHIRPTSSRVSSSSSSSSSDIYGAESQWSTKLTGNSFQPSSYTPNHPITDEKAADVVGREKAGDFPEIITAGPDLSSIAVLVTSDDVKAKQRPEPSSSSEESIMGSMLESMIDFGKKMNAAEENDNPTTTSTTTESRTQASTDNVPEIEIKKNSSATFKKAGLRRRRVRVRVRPATSSGEDFVTAESQSYDSPLNHLSREPNKFRNFYVTAAPTTTTEATTTTTTTITTTEIPKPKKSLFETFFDKMLGESEEITTTTVPEIITTTTTSSPNEVWTNPSTIVPSTEINRDELTTFKDSGNPTTIVHQFFEVPTTLKNIQDENGNTEPPVIVTTMIDNADVYTTTNSDPITTSTDSTTTIAQKSEESKSNSGENVIQSLNQENSLKYFVTKSPAFNEYLRHQEKAEMSKDNPNYPKNHRSKWSEVRYPTDKSLFDFAKWNQNQTGDARYNADKQSTVTESNGASATDYVKAIFESIKSADEEHHQNDKLVDETGSTGASSSRPDNESSKEENTTPYPTEVKTSISSSSRVVARPTVSFVKNTDNSATTTSTAESITFGPFVPSMMSDKITGPIKKSSFETNLGRILKTTTTTKVSHMTEICYRGRCIMSKPKKEVISR